jgi:ApaG protein
VNSSSDIFELPGLHVSVDRVMYQPHLATNDERPHCFVYFITIHNDSHVMVTIKGRKWVVTNANGEVTAVEGEGVVGHFPSIPPGSSFSYNSFHVTESLLANAEGSYLGVDSSGRKVLTRIPRFELRVPEEHK